MFIKKYINTSNLYFWIALFIAYTIAIINGLRLPTLWSVNYYLPSFFDGFFRRSLAGTILSFLGDFKYHYWTIALIQILIFIGFNLIIIKNIKDKSTLRWLYILFLIGPAGGFMFHIIGYIDYVLYLALFLAISFKNKWFANFIVITSLFFHEMALLTTIPLYIAYKVYKKENLTSIISFSAIAFLTFVILSYFSKEVPIQDVQAFTKTLQEKADFNFRKDYYELFGTTYYKIWYTKEYLFQVLILSPIYIVCYFLQIKNYNSGNRLNKLTITLISIFSCVSPLFLGLSGYDINRWIFLTLLNSLFIMNLYYKDFYQYKKIIFGIMILYISIGHLYYFDKKHPRLQNIDNINILLPDLKESLLHKPEKY